MRLKRIALCPDVSSSKSIRDSKNKMVTALRRSPIKRWAGNLQKPLGQGKPRLIRWNRMKQTRDTISASQRSNKVGGLCRRLLAYWVAAQSSYHFRSCRPPSFKGGISTLCQTNRAAPSALTISRAVSAFARRKVAMACSGV